jgi:phosphatidylserine/phosphatidylglycerophosphate/cardiolipin synthase-like enzyme
VTSDNFTVKNTTFRTDKKKFTVADVWVSAIEDAEHQILIASGHLRLRPVAEALIAKREADPDIDIRVYVDQQEFVSQFTQDKQDDKLEACLDEATSASKEFNCLHKSYLWARRVSDAGIDVRYKTYALRWHFSYAVQMHHKFMIIDGERLLTGSYNLSINAEHSTFENVMDFSAPGYQSLVDTYADEFESLWDTGDGKLASLKKTIKTADKIPLVFKSMALSGEEVTELRRLIRKNCPAVDSEAFRKFPEKHRVCHRDQAR